MASSGLSRELAERVNKAHYLIGPAAAAAAASAVEASFLPNRIVPSARGAGGAPATRIPRVSLRVIQRVRGESAPVVRASPAGEWYRGLAVSLRERARQHGVAAQGHVQVAPQVAAGAGEAALEIPVGAATRLELARVRGTREQAGQIRSGIAPRRRPLEIRHRLGHVIPPQRGIVVRQRVLPQATHRATYGVSPQRRPADSVGERVFPRVIDRAHGRAQGILPQGAGEGRGVQLFSRGRQAQGASPGGRRGGVAVVRVVTTHGIFPALIRRAADGASAAPAVLLGVFAVDLAALVDLKLVLDQLGIVLQLLQLDVPEESLEAAYGRLLVRRCRHRVMVIRSRMRPKTRALGDSYGPSPAVWSVYRSTLRMQHDFRASLVYPSGHLRRNSLELSRPVTFTATRMLISCHAKTSRPQSFQTRSTVF